MHIHNMLSCMFCFCKDGYLLVRCLFGVVWAYSALGTCIQLLAAEKAKNSTKENTVLGNSYWNFKLSLLSSAFVSILSSAKNFLFTKNHFHLFIIIS